METTSKSPGFLSRPEVLILITQSPVGVHGTAQL